MLIYNFLTDWLLATWLMIVSSAPWLLFGFFCAGLLHVFLSPGAVERHLRLPGVASVVKASIMGIPLPLCSCSVIPVAVSLWRRGASRGATASFAVSTPEIGVDSFLLSYVLLGPFFAVARVISAFAAALSTGLLIDFSTETESARPQELAPDQPAEEDTGAVAKRSAAELGKEVFNFGFKELFDDLAKYLAFGFLLAGLISALVPPEVFAEIDLHPFWVSVVMLGVSLPFYVCATSSTPLAAVLLAKGLAPGAVLVFLLAGPATNISTMLVLKAELGKKALLLYLVAIVITTMLCAWVVNGFWEPKADFGGIDLGAHGAEHIGPMSMVAGLILTGLLFLSILRHIRQARAQKACCKCCSA